MYILCLSWPGSAHGNVSRKECGGFAILITLRILHLYSIAIYPATCKKGDWPSCGVDPSSVLEYEDPENPYRVTREVDGDGTATLYAYDEHGQMTSRVEAFAAPLGRETRWTYHDVYPALPVEREQPSTYPTAIQRTIWSYDARGLLESRTEEGIESGQAYFHTTRYSYTAVGRQEWVDPPGFEVPGKTDVTTMTYDPARRGQLASSTDPIVGTTTYST